MFGVLGQRNLLSLLVVAIREGSIGTTLLLFMATSGVGCTTLVDHEDVEVSNLQWQVIHTEGRMVAIKATSVRNTMRDLKPTVLVTAVINPLNWGNNMDVVRGNDCVVDIINNLCTQDLINGACILV